MAYVTGFEQIDRTKIAEVGGKGAQLAELSRIEGIRVPAGFCVTTQAFQWIMAELPSIDDRLERLGRADPADLSTIRTQSAEIRRLIEGAATGYRSHLISVNLLQRSGAQLTRRSKEL